MGNATHGGQPWVGISLDRAFDVQGAFNPTIISGNSISLMDVPVQAIGQTRNTLLTGNNLNNWLGRAPYRFSQAGNYAVMNVLNGTLESRNGTASR